MNSVFKMAVCYIHPCLDCESGGFHVVYNKKESRCEIIQVYGRSLTTRLPPLQGNKQMSIRPPPSFNRVPDYGLYFSGTGCHIYIATGIFFYLYYVLSLNIRDYAHQL